MRTLDKFAAIPTDLEPLGLIRYDGMDNDFRRYWCAPVNAITFAHEGVDGVHNCIIPNEDDPTLEHSPIYTVNPADSDHCISIIAANFYDFISLVVEVKFAGILENINRLTKEQYLEFLQETAQYHRDNPEIMVGVPEAVAALSEAFRDNIKKIDGVYDHVKELQDKTDMANIKYSAEYYDALGITNNSIKNTETHEHTTVMFRQEAKDG